MVERYLLAFLARSRGSKGGTVLIVVGVVVLLAFLIFGLISTVGNIILTITGIGPVVEFLGTGRGVLAGFVVAVFIILLGVAFLRGATPQTQSVSSIQQSETTQAAKDREIERLQKRLNRTEQERDRYRDILADPTAKKQRDERMARSRSLEVAQELQIFWNARKYSDPGETVASFRQRQEWKVNDVRGRLDELKMLTPRESDDLTFRPDHSYPDRIEKMIGILRNIGMGT
jgi:hypothetical protein